MAIPEVLLAYGAYKLMKETVGTPSDWITDAKKNKKDKTINLPEQTAAEEKAVATAQQNTALQKVVDEKNKQQSTESLSEAFGIANMLK